MTRPTLLALAPTLALALACGSGDPEETVPPVLDEAATGDEQVDLVDRSAVLAEAAEAEDAPDGVALDLNAAGDGFLMKIDSAEEIGTLDDDLRRAATYDAVVHGVAAAAFADAVVALVVAPPAAAVEIVRNGTVTEVSKNVWIATNTVSDGTNSVTGTFVVAWVGVGWLAEMRLTSSDGTWSGQPWFNGFVSVENAVGWWDFYDPAGTLGGVVEWVADGEGNGQFGIAATAGENAGDVLSYSFVDGVARIDFYDASADDTAWVQANADKSGEVRLPDYNGGVAACWDAEAAAEPYADVTCPAE